MTTKTPPAETKAPKEPNPIITKNPQVVNAKPGTHPLGEGLSLVVTATCKSWRFKYYQPITKKRQNMSFGKYPEVSLADARKRRDEARALIAAGVCPLADRKSTAEAQKREAASTFGAVAAMWLDSLKPNVTESYHRQTKRRLEAYALGKGMRDMPVKDVRAPQVTALLRTMESGDTIHRLLQSIKAIMNFAVVEGLADFNPCSAITKAANLPSHTVEHMPAMEPEEILELVATIDGASMSFTIRHALWWSLHTLVRPVEAARARWDEIDIERRLWVIPAERMKMGRDHRIPLSDKAVEILEAMRPLSGNREHVFPNRRDPKRPMNEQSVNCALRRIGLAGRQTAHGLRALGSSTLHPAGFISDVIEAALAHADNNKVRASYQRGDYLAQRVELMGWWSAHIERARAGELTPGVGDNVIDIQTRKAG